LIPEYHLGTLCFVARVLVLAHRHRRHTPLLPHLKHELTRWGLGCSRWGLGYVLAARWGLGYVLAARWGLGYVLAARWGLGYVPAARWGLGYVPAARWGLGFVPAARWGLGYVPAARWGLGYVPAARWGLGYVLAAPPPQALRGAATVKSNQIKSNQNLHRSGLDEASRLRLLSPAQEALTDSGAMRKPSATPSPKLTSTARLSPAQAAHTDPGPT